MDTIIHAKTEAGRTTRASKWALASMGGIVAVALAALGLGAATGEAPKLSAAAQTDAPAGPSETEYRANWPRFRGPEGNGVALSSNVPVSFNLETGENLLWRSELPRKGFNSPVVWGDRVFLTGSDERARELFCFDAVNGALLWRLPVKLISDAAVKAMNTPTLCGLTAPTVATDGERVYAMFTTGELIAADFAGRLVWTNNLGRPDNIYGHAASLVTWRDRVLLQFDQANVEAGKSRLIAFDGRTGRVLWEKRRPVAASWTTPLVAKMAGRECLITAGEPWVLAYDPSDGKEIWRFGGFRTEQVPSPVLADGLLVAVDAGRRFIGIKPDGRGDVTATQGVWTNQENVPDISSPVSQGEWLFTLGTGGGLACFEAKMGKKLWEQDLKEEFQASPVIAGQRLYLFSTEGEMVVVVAARKFAEIGRSKLGEAVFASPAIVRDRLYVRGEKHLFCLGANAGNAAGQAR